jgi:hypothetical protein
MIEVGRREGRRTRPPPAVVERFAIAAAVVLLVVAAAIPIVFARRAAPAERPTSPVPIVVTDPVDEPVSEP